MTECAFNQGTKAAAHAVRRFLRDLQQVPVLLKLDFCQCIQLHQQRRNPPHISKRTARALPVHLDLLQLIISSLFWQVIDQF